MNWICVDGDFVPSNLPVLYADNRAFRYADGLFETMKMVNGKIPLEEYHFDRLFSGLHLLQYKLLAGFSKEILSKQIAELCKKNNFEKLARIRLTVFRGNGNLYGINANTNYIIECYSLGQSSNEMNETGLQLDVFPDAIKSCDKFSNLKSTNFLLYVLAANFAASQMLDECLVLNTKGNIADGTITNIFLIQSGKLLTSSLQEGCINGVMRKYLIEGLKKGGYTIEEGTVSVEDIQNADEVFLTNAVQGIKWVKTFKKKQYSNLLTRKIFNQFVKPLFQN